jgi:two-component sensor histidine kinase
MVFAPKIAAHSERGPLVATQIPLNPDAGSSLALAMVAASTVPVALLDGDLIVVGLSASFCNAYTINAVSATGQPFLGLGAGEWDVPQLRSLLENTVAGIADVDAYEMSLTMAGREPRRLVLNARKLDYGDGANTRLILTIVDITDARIAEKLKDDLLREKAVLLQEIQHRVANSLQIIASVILQNARKVQSEETRSHLQDAHQRVMSVAVLQQQLARTQSGDVELRSYFNGLCKSIGASMIRDHNQVSLSVDADDSTVRADVSISLGLIVTELVINALKHAFPSGRKGKIIVGYQSVEADWTMSVSDDGVGMPADPANAKPGLGTSIVEALANQLRARVQIVDAKPGTSISIVHTEAAPMAAHASV